MDQVVEVIGRVQRIESRNAFQAGSVAANVSDINELVQNFDFELRRTLNIVAEIARR
jgi:hypothetical protein